MELIVSGDYRKFLEDNKIELLDWDKATLIYNHKVASFEEKMKELRVLCEQTQDEKLKKQIMERITQEYDYLAQFKENGGNAYFQLGTWGEEECHWDEIYLDFDSAFSAGMREGEVFRIRKECFACKKEAGEKQGVYGCIEYDKGGNIGNQCYLYSVGDEKEIDWDKKRFEDRYVDLPYCFRQGDIVKIVGTELYGIIYGIEDDADEERHCAFGRNGDYSDFQLTVDLIYKGEKYLSVFSHEHIPPTEIEYARLIAGDSRRGFLEYMKEALHRNSFWGGGQRDAARMDEVLRKIKKVWKQYPDFRLGQLLVNVCGVDSLFYLEDEHLMERLQKNIFPIED